MIYLYLIYLEKILFALFIHESGRMTTWQYQALGVNLLTLKKH